MAQEEMLGKVNDGDWSVLVMDPEATRIMSAACRVSEILNYGVARAPRRGLAPAPVLEPREVLSMQHRAP